LQINWPLAGKTNYSPKFSSLDSARKEIFLFLEFSQAIPASFKLVDY
jgi:hypothetical protein